MCWNNVVSYEDNVKAVLAKVALGEANAGIVYTSDISGENAGKVIQVQIPEALNVIATYPIAPVAGGKSRPGAGIHGPGTITRRSGHPGDAQRG